jgi:hypothetical protein
MTSQQQMVKSTNLHVNLITFHTVSKPLSVPTGNIDQNHIY